MDAAPIRTYRTILYGQDVEVKVYATPPAPPTYSNHVKYTGNRSGKGTFKIDVDDTFYVEPRTTKYAPHVVNLRDWER